MLPTFALAEVFAFGSQYTWRLKESEIRFRGSGDFERLVMHRIPATAERIEAFFSALDLLQVWDWRNNYDPGDAGYAVMDGSSWTFTASFEGRECRSGGVNAYPAFANPIQTAALDRGRFGLLCASLYDCFAIDLYIQQAKRFIELEVKLQSEKDGRSE